MKTGRGQSIVFKTKTKQSRYKQLPGSVIAGTSSYLGAIV